MLVIRPGEMAAALNSWPTSANWKFQIDAGLPYLDDQRPILSPEAAVQREEGDARRKLHSQGRLAARRRERSPTSGIPSKPP
jgi:hypothetical protein